MLSQKSEKTLKQLREKATYGLDAKKVKMPSLKNINELLEELGVRTWFYESQNTVEYSSAGNVYVNSRHDGKKGYELKCEIGEHRISLDTSESYYSVNTRYYAYELLEAIDTLI
jgi:hypothetical protein